MSNLSLKHLLLAATVAIAGTFSCRQAEELSSEAEIVSFTFDTSVDANSIVTSQPVINGDSITFVSAPTPFPSGSPPSFPPSLFQKTRQYHLHQARLWTSQKEL